MPYLGAYSIDDYLTFAVNTHNNKGQARDADSVPFYHIYEEETATPIVTGTMALLNGSNTVGFYSEQVQLTAAKGFELGKCYNIYIEATVQGTQGSISHLFQLPAKTGYSLSTVGVDAIWDDGLSNNNTTGTAGYILSSVLNAVDNIAITGAPAYDAPSSYVLSTGTQTGGTYQSVDTTNNVYHVHTDNGGLLDLYYEYSLKSDEEAVGILFKGRINGSNDSVNIQAYDWTNSVWVIVHTLIGTNLTTDTNVSSALVSKYTGTGSDAGKVRIRFVNAVTLTTATLYIDQMIVGKTITGRSVGYANGAVWLDTNLSNTSTVSYVDGVADKPVSTLAAARTIASAVGLRKISVANGSTITLASDSSNLEFMGDGWTLALGGQNIAGSSFEGATITGIGTGATAPMFRNCLLGTVTLPPCILWNCLITSNTAGGFTCSGAGDYFLYSCASGIAGNNRPSITFFNGDCNVNLRNYSGGITLLSMATGCDCSVEGRGNCVIDSSCTGGTVVIRGLFTLTNNGTGMSVTDAARFAEDQNIYAVTNGWVSASGTVSATIPGYVSVTGTVNANIISSDNIDFTALQKTSLNAATPASVGSVTNPVTVSGYVNVTGTVVASSVTGNVGGSVNSVVNPVTVTGYVNVTGTVVASSVTNAVTVGTNNDKSDYLLSAAGVTAITDDVFTEVIEGTTTFKTWMRRIGAVLFGKASGGGVAGSKKFRDSTDTVDRIDIVTDNNGNRTSASYDDTNT